VIPRIVFDTNTRISSLIFKGTPLEATGKARPPAFQQVISRPLLDEFRGALARKFRYTNTSIDAVIETLLKDCLVVSTVQNITASRDPDDDRVLECAVAAEANLIVSGDKDLLVLGSFHGISILTVRQFLDSQFSQAVHRLP
jgi:uncharacterized protein